MHRNTTCGGGNSNEPCYLLTQRLPYMHHLLLSLGSLFTASPYIIYTANNIYSQQYIHHSLALLCLRCPTSLCSSCATQAGCYALAPLCVSPVYIGLSWHVPGYPSVCPPHQPPSSKHTTPIIMQPTDIMRPHNTTQYTTQRQQRQRRHKQPIWCCNPHPLNPHPHIHTPRKLLAACNSRHGVAQAVIGSRGAPIGARSR